MMWWTIPVAGSPLGADRQQMSMSANVCIFIIGCCSSEVTICNVVEAHCYAVDNGQIDCVVCSWQGYETQTSCNQVVIEHTLFVYCMLNISICLWMNALVSLDQWADRSNVLMPLESVFKWTGKPVCSLLLIHVYNTISSIHLPPPPLPFHRPVGCCTISVMSSLPFHPLQHET